MPETPKLVPCECVTCCDGEHAGDCRECAGWGHRISDDGIVSCDYCYGSGVCPKCNGESKPDEAALSLLEPAKGGQG